MYVSLRVGQCWGFPILDEELGSTSVYEILSFNKNTAGEAAISLLQCSGSVRTPWQPGVWFVPRTDLEAACIGALPPAYTTPSLGC